MFGVDGVKPFLQYPWLDLWCRPPSMVVGVDTSGELQEPPGREGRHKRTPRAAKRGDGDENSARFPGGRNFRVS